MLYILFGVYLSNHPLWLFCIIWINMVVVTLWYLFGHCIITDIENYFRLPEDIDTNENKSFILTTVETYLPFLDKSLIENIVSSIPAMVTLICLVKLYLQYPKVSNNLNIAVSEIRQIPISNITETLLV